MGHSEKIWNIKIAVEFNFSTAILSFFRVMLIVRMIQECRIA